MTGSSAEAPSRRVSSDVGGFESRAVRVSIFKITGLATNNALRSLQARGSFGLISNNPPTFR
jgi:hypothetical protein